MLSDASLKDRATAALVGVALGDALGMPSQTLSREAIVAHYGRIDDFVTPYQDHPVSHGLVAGQITDDTEQTLLLAEHWIAGQGELNPFQWAQALIDWEKDILQRELRDLLGPSTKVALEALLAGVPVHETGRRGTTNGAAMRIVPVGIAVPCTDLPTLVTAVERACRVTHNTGEAIAAAAAVAAIVSAGVDGADFDSALPTALSAARLGAVRGYATGKRDIAERIEQAMQLIDRHASIDALVAHTGNSVASFEAVPAAFGIVRLALGDPWQAAKLAANAGDDTDTIGAIATGMAAACKGLDALPLEKIDTVMAANDLYLTRFTALATELLALRVKAAATLPCSTTVKPT